MNYTELKEKDKMGKKIKELEKEIEILKHIIQNYYRGESK